MTIREMRDLYPHLFYEQTWYLGEPFLDVPLPPGPVLGTPLRAVGEVPWPTAGHPLLPLAVQLVHAFVREPGAAIWQRYLWCADLDRLGQRIYVGGTSVEGGNRLELHRHLHITTRWGIPRWS